MDEGSWGRINERIRVSGQKGDSLTGLCATTEESDFVPGEIKVSGGFFTESSI